MCVLYLAIHIGSWSSWRERASYLCCQRSGWLKIWHGPLCRLSMLMSPDSMSIDRCCCVVGHMRGHMPRAVCGEWCCRTQLPCLSLSLSLFLSHLLIGNFKRAFHLRTTETVFKEESQFCFLDGVVVIGALWVLSIGFTQEVRSRNPRIRP
jgi:hypothetical protein